MNKEHDFKRHTVAFGREGDALSLDTLEPYCDRKEFDIQIDAIARAILQFKNTQGGNDKVELLMYVHGALNSPKGARKRAKCEFRKILSDGKYPIFVNWDAGMFGAYAEYLFNVRQGRKVRWSGWITSPFYLAYDLTHAIAKLPLTWGYQFKNRFVGATGLGTFDRNATWVNQQIRKIFVQRGDVEGVIRISSEPDRDIRSTGEKILVAAIIILMSIPRLVISPILASAGTNAWNIYKRRTYNLFRKPDEFDVRKERKRNVSVFQAVRRTGDFAYFLDSLISRLGGGIVGSDSSGEKRRDAVNQHFSISLVGHSTGAIVLNNLITEYPDLEYSNIVYMGAACTIRDMYRTVIPYMLRSSQTRFYVLALDPKAELRESFGLPVLPTGSLLEWLDVYFTSPPQNLDRMLGKWVNLMATQHIFPREIRQRVTLKRFRYRVKGQPQKHGEFDDFHNFHSEEYWSELS